MIAFYFEGVMMRGKYLAFPRERTLVLDVVHAARVVPSFPVDRKMNLAEVAHARQEATTRISWTAIFLRAYGLTCAEIPMLKRWYAPLPWSRWYEHEHSVGTVSVNRRDTARGIDRLIWCQIASPEEKFLVDIQAALDLSKCGEINEVFRHGHRFSRLPRVVRRISWWLLMRCMARKKAKKLGTFSISTLAGLHATNRYHPLIFTTSLTYTELDAAGDCEVTLLCDHRTMDGVLAAEALEVLRLKLVGPVLSELRQLARSDG